MKSTARKPSSRKRSKKITASPPTSSAKQMPTILDNLSSINIAKLLSGFMTFRSTVKDLSHSLQRMESFMDSAYQVFEKTSSMMEQSRNRGFKNPSSLLPTLPNTKKGDEEEIPVIRLPFERQGGPFERQGGPSFPLAPLLQNLNFNHLWRIIQSPLFRNLISSMLQGKQNATTSSQSKRKQG